jgi:hypothetical protein
MNHIGAILTLAAQTHITNSDLERAVGFVSYDFMFRTCCRSVFQQVFVDMHAAGTSRKAAFVSRSWVAESWLELVLSAVLLPLGRHNLDAHWACRVEAYDASPGGHGRAWTTYPTDTVAQMARWCDQHSPATHLQGAFGIDVDSSGACPLRRIRLPAADHWSTAPRPGGFKHITLEEFEARNWSVEASLLRPSEVSSRILRAGDNAATVGAAAKGRSPSRPLNRLCRRAAALELAGDLCVFDFWVRSSDNPADGPSSKYGIRSGTERRSRG